MQDTSSSATDTGGLCAPRPRSRWGGGGRTWRSVSEGGAECRWKRDESRSTARWLMVGFACIPRDSPVSPVTTLRGPLAEPLEEWIEEAVQAALAGPRLDRARRRLERGAADEQRLVDSIAEDEAMLSQLGADFANRLIPRSAYDSALATVQERIDEARGRSPSAPAPRPSTASPTSRPSGRASRWSAGGPSSRPWPSHASGRRSVRATGSTRAGSTRAGRSEV